MPDLVNKYPYTNFAGVNLDYILDELNKLKDSGAVQAGYIQTVEIDNNVITFKNGLGETVATVDTIKRAEKDINNQDITGYIRNVVSTPGKTGIEFYNGNSNKITIKYPTYILIADATDVVGTYQIDNTSYSDFTNFLAAVDSGYPARLVLREDDDVVLAVPVYKSGTDYYIECWMGSSWKCFALLFESAGIPAVQTVTLTQVNT